jgi:hypothetical protein
MSEEVPMEVLFVNVDEDFDTHVVSYQAEKHLPSACKFLYWPAQDSPRYEALLVVGRHSPRLEKHKRLIEELNGRYGTQERRPSGAGEVYFNKKVGWHSHGFELETPEELRPLILKALGIE